MYKVNICYFSWWCQLLRLILSLLSFEVFLFIYTYLSILCVVHPQFVWMQRKICFLYYMLPLCEANICFSIESERRRPPDLKEFCSSVSYLIWWPVMPLSHMQIWWWWCKYNFRHPHSPVLSPKGWAEKKYPLFTRVLCTFWTHKCDICNWNKSIIILQKNYLCISLNLYFTKVRVLWKIIHIIIINILAFLMIMQVHQKLRNGWILQIELVLKNFFKFLSFSNLPPFPIHWKHKLCQFYMSSNHNICPWEINILF